MYKNEIERQQTVRRFLNLEISKEKELQEIVQLAAEICGTPTAQVTLIDEDTQYVRFKVGSGYNTASRQDAFCNHVIEQDYVMMVPDALLDERFANNPLVTGDPNIRFYAGSPLTTQDGHNLGSLCVIDQSPKLLSDHQQRMLEILAKQVIQLMEFDASVTILKEQYAEARASEIKLRSFFESSNSYHFLIGMDLEIIAFNKALAGYLENAFQVRVATGMPVKDFIPPVYQAEFMQYFKRALSGEAFRIERLMSQGDEMMWWFIIIEPAHDSEGAIIGVSLNATDITKTVQQQQKIVAQNDSLNKIAFMQSHELRRPVATIIGLMELIKLEGHGSSIEELSLMEKAVKELDEKIRLIVNYTD
jgi:PAS domain S-box-containing protein